MTGVIPERRGSVAPISSSYFLFLFHCDSSLFSKTRPLNSNQKMVHYTWFLRMIDVHDQYQWRAQPDQTLIVYRTKKTSTTWTSANKLIINNSLWIHMLMMQQILFSSVLIDQRPGKDKFLFLQPQLHIDMRGVRETTNVRCFFLSESNLRYLCG